MTIAENVHPKAGRHLTYSSVFQKELLLDAIIGDTCYGWYTFAGLLVFADSLAASVMAVVLRPFS